MANAGLCILFWFYHITASNNTHPHTHLLFAFHPPTLHCIIARICICGALCQHTSRQIRSVNIHSSILLLLPYNSLPLIMSPPTTSTSTTSEMADPVTPQPSWMPLIKPSLLHQVMNKGSYIPPNTKCSIIYGPEVSI